ncbi:MAG: LysR family transcriptional regulator [Bryobacteraceae bacterium]|nr:LysR family transcriptional regulator [Bryobacteraceae bacterium]
MDTSIELRHLRYFLAVAETLHFGRAAQQLGMAQPPLSQQIKKLETLLGYALFDRTTRGVQLTPVGRFFLERSRTSLQRLSEDVERTRRFGAGHEGELTVGFAGSTMFTGLPTGIERYRRLYPGIALRLRELVTTDQLEALHAGTLDLAFLRDSHKANPLIIRSILQERFVAVFPTGHPLASRTSLRPRDLQGLPFVLFPRSMGVLAFDRTMECCEDDGFRPDIVQEAPQWPTLIRLVAAGLGVSLAPACVANIVLPGLVYRSVRSPRRTSVDAGVRPGPIHPAVTAFLKIAEQEMQLA